MIPILRDPAPALFSLVYVVSVLAIGVWAAKRTRDSRDFFIAGQRLGLWVTGLATMSAAFSGVVFVGGPGLTYRMGMASLWIVLPVGFTAGLLCFVVGRRLRELAGESEIYTIPDVVAHRFRNRGSTVVAAIAVVSGSVAYLAAQLLALGILVQAIFGLRHLGLAVIASLTVILAYSVVGGMVAGVYTDVFQGVMMLVAAIAVFVLALQRSGGWTELWGSLERAPALGRSIIEPLGSVPGPAFGRSFIEPLGSVPALTTMGFFFVFGIGVLGQPQMLHKFFMIKDPRSLKWMPAVLGGSQALCLLIWVGVGFAVPALVAQGKMTPGFPADQAAPRFLLEFGPAWLTGFAFAAVLAAIMSTSDSFLNLGAAALARDLPRALGRPLSNELRGARVAVALLGVLAVLLALSFQDLIALLGTLAFGTFAAALTPTLAVGLNSSRVTASAATASMLTGLILNLGIECWQRQTWFPGLPELPIAAGMLPSTLALSGSFAVLLSVSALSARG